MEIKERPILLKRHEVIAILEGRQTQLCRTNGFEWTNSSMPEMWDKVETGSYKGESGAWFRFDDCGINRDTFVKCPYGQPGDRLWGREKFQPIFAEGFDHGSGPYPNYKTGFGYAISYPATDGIIEWIDGDDNITDRCRPSTNMPRWASRILLEIVSVRVQRLNEISEADAKAEGAPDYEEGVDAPPPDDGDYSWSYCASFRNLWESINGEGSWQTNPWVWVIEFRKI